jgi:glycosyltransferase involved in cell wall biosynthesis
MTAQSYRNLEIIIADNCSAGPETEQVAREFMKADPRIRYFRHLKNLGAVANFEFLLDKAAGEFFLWATDDDEWEPGFIESCAGQLLQHPEAGMAFCAIVNIDAYGATIREYPHFPRFAGAGQEMIERYLRSPEFCGKANLIYSLYRTELCRAAWKASPLNNGWGSDMAFVLGALARSGICIDSRVLFRKRYERPSDTPGRADRIIVGADSGTYDLPHACSYIRNNLRAVRGTPYYWLTLRILLGRLPLSFLDFCLRLFRRIRGTVPGRGA